MSVQEGGLLIRKSDGKLEKFTQLPVITAALQRRNSGMEGLVARARTPGGRDGLIAGARSSS